MNIIRSDLIMHNDRSTNQQLHTVLRNIYHICRMRNRQYKWNNPHSKTAYVWSRIWRNKREENWTINVLCVTMLTLNSENVWPKCTFVTMLDYSQGEANRFPERMFQTINLLGANSLIVFQTRLESTWLAMRLIIRTCMWCIGPISKTNISLYIFPFPSMILYKHLHWNKQKTIRYNQGYDK